MAPWTVAHQDTVMEWNAMECHGIIQARILEWGAIPFSRGSEPRAPALQEDSLLSEPPGKPKVRKAYSMPLGKLLRCLYTARTDRVWETTALTNAITSCDLVAI